MKIGIFPVMAGRRGGGPETYEHNLVQSMSSYAPENNYHVFCLSEAAAQSFPETGDNVHYEILKPGWRTVSMALSLPLAVKRSQPDIFHSTFTPPPFSPGRNVFTMHDTSMFEHPEFYPTLIRLRLNRLIKSGLRKSKMIICISEHCRQTVQDYFGIPDERLAVAYHGIDPRITRVDEEQARKVVVEHYGLDAPYMLYVGKFEKRKNVFRILRAYREFIDQNGRDVKLVMVGKRDWNAEAFDALVAELDLGDHVIQPGYVDSAHLPALYSAAEVFLFASLWEGFGLPVLESMACGTPVITSNGSSLAEVAGDAALLVDPYDVSDIAAAMNRLHNDNELKQQFVQKGFDRTGHFSLEQCAAKTLEAYQRALEA
ncbi:MAG: glycosyltransferase family 4 protein [Gammaproteobacteria bacterium]